MGQSDSTCKMTPDEWHELLEYQMKVAEAIREDVKKSFESKKINSFSYKSCSAAGVADKNTTKPITKHFGI